jgi:hypothetical protein
MDLHGKLDSPLRDESVHIECWFLDKQSDGHWLYVFMKTEDMQKAKEAGKSSTKDIHLFHQEFKKLTWDRSTREVLEELVMLDASQ